MRTRYSLSIVIGILILLITVFTLKSAYLTAQPTVDTADVHIQEGQATLEGIIHNTGGKSVSQYGFRWGTDRGLDQEESLPGGISANKPFISTIKGLKEGETYYYRAYATNAKGIAYGDIKSFTVPVKYNAPPAVSIDSPGTDQIINRGETVKIAASATDDKRVETMELYINGASKTRVGDGRLTYNWDTSGASPGKYTVKVTAGDGKKSGERAFTLTVKDEPKANTCTQVASNVTLTNQTTPAKTVSTPSRGVSSKYPKVSKANGAFGQFHYRDIGGGRIEIDPQWLADNIVTIKLPGLNRYVQVHKNAKDNFIQAFNYIANGTATINGKQVPLLSLIKTMDGTFVPRHVNWNSSRGLSNHSWGTAIDINAANHFRYVDSAREPYDPNYILWVKAFKPAGFSWGNSYADSMHYELIK